MEYIAFEKKVRIVFVFQVASFWTSWEKLYQSCLEDERFEVKLMWIDDISGDVAQMASGEEFLIKRNIEYDVFDYEKIMRFQPHYMVYQTPYDKGHRPISTWSSRFRRSGIRIIYIPYGIEISDTRESRYKHFALPVVINAFRIYVISQEMKKEYEKYCINSKAVLDMGLPRFDVLKDKEKFALSETLINRINNRKVILWKTHFPKIFIENEIKKQATPKLEEYIKFVDFIRETPDLFFIFMPHPKFVDETIDESLRMLAKTLIEKLEKLENVYIDTKDDYRYSLMNSDAIIVDRSAVMVEAGAVGVPVLYMYNSDYSEPMTPPIQKLLDSYYQGETAEEMKKFCIACLSDLDERKEEREKVFAECVPYFDGKCAQRIKEELLEEVQKEHKNEIVERFTENAEIFMFGTGGISRYCMDIYYGTKEKSNLNVHVKGFIDNDKKKQKEYRYGKPIIAPDEINQKQFDYIVIGSNEYVTEIYTQLTKDLGVPKEKILSFDQFLTLTAFPEHLRNKYQYKEIRS